MAHWTNKLEKIEAWRERVGGWKGSGELGEFFEASPAMLKEAILQSCEKSAAAIVVGSSGNILATNLEWRELCGYTHEESVGKSPAALLHGALTDRAAAASFTLELEQRGQATTTLWNYSKDGRAFLHRLEATTVSLEGSEPASSDGTWPSLPDSPTSTAAILPPSDVRYYLAESEEVVEAESVDEVQMWSRAVWSRAVTACGIM